MNASRSQLIVDRLHQLQASAPDIEATAVVSADGLTIASALTQTDRGRPSGCHVGCHALTGGTYCQ